MKISVVCLASRSGGGLAILNDLIEFARQHTDNYQWQFLLSDQQVGISTSNIEIIHLTPSYKGWRSRIWAELIQGRKAIQEFHPDFVLSLQNIDTPARGKYPLALYMHQALPFQTDYRLSFLKAAERKLAWRQYLLKFPIKFSINRAKITFVQTKWLETSIRQVCPNGDVHAIGFNGAHSDIQEEVQRLPTDRLFYPAAATSYKNHVLLHQALQKLHRQGFNLTHKVTLTVEKNQFEKLVNILSPEELEWYFFAGWLTEKEVAFEYKRSILVFPSLVESLGLPLYEAQKLRSVVVAPQLPYAQEALKQYPASTFFDPKDPDSLVEALKTAWKLSQNNSQRIHNQSKSPNSWETMLSFLAEK